MPISDEIECPICKEKKMREMDGVYECFACGAFESINDRGMVLTTAVAPIGFVKVIKKQSRRGSGKE